MRHWYDQAIIYQIYPKSFQDSNSDGIGDLNGIRKRIPYLKELGINAVWLNPILFLHKWIMAMMYQIILLLIQRWEQWRIWIT